MWGTSWPLKSTAVQPRTQCRTTSGLSCNNVEALLVGVVDGARWRRTTVKSRREIEVGPCLQ